ncbi:hypothetical protein PWT90_05918 [Aphanocladium album]|nr:hypothetical protein PWT90_05918 [Aphanocladium album]
MVFSAEYARKCILAALLLFLSLFESVIAQDGPGSGTLPTVDGAAGIEPSDMLYSTGEIDAMLNDGQMRRTYVALMSMFSDTSREAADKYGVEELSMLSNDLDSHLQQINANTEEAYRVNLTRLAKGRVTQPDGQVMTAEAMLSAMDARKRQLSASNKVADIDYEKSVERRLFGGLFGGGRGGRGGQRGGGNDAGGNQPAGAGSAPQEQGGLITRIITNVAGNLAGRFFNGASGSLAGAGFFGGVGAGQGAAQALNFASAAKSKATAQQVAQENGIKSTFLGPILQNAATGLTATALRAVMSSNVIKIPPLGGLAASLGAGAGSGGAMGLGLTTKNVAPNLNGSSLEDVAGGLGFGATQAFTSNLNLTGGLSSILAGVDIGATAKGLGSSIGKGAALGLRLTSDEKAPPPPPPISASDIPGIASSFSFDLSRSFTGAIDGNNIAGLIPQNLNFGDAALSIGNGLGGGAAKGLKLAAQDRNLAPPPPASNNDLPGIAGTFAFGLSNSFTDGVDINRQLLASMLPNISIGDAALGVGDGIGKGAAVGLKLANASAVMPPPPPKSPGDIPGIAGSLSFGLSRSFTDSLDQKALVGAVIPANLDIGGAALSIGNGIGNGAARGLKLSSKNIAPPNVKDNADLPGIAGALAFGLSNSLADNVNVSGQSLAAMIPPIDFQSAALNIGNGLGTGAALGLKLTDKDTSGFEAPSTPSMLSVGAVPRLAGTLAFGVSKSLSGAVNISNLNLMQGLIPPNLDIGGTVLGAGRGLGSGAALGLGVASIANNTLRRRADKMPSTGASLSDLPKLAEMFTFGLGNSFTEKINLTERAKSLASQLPPVDLGKTVLSVGSAIGLGSAKGLGLSKNDTAGSPNLPKSLQDVPEIAGTFAFGLTDAVTSAANITQIAGRLFGNGKDFIGTVGASVASGIGKGLGRGAAVGLGLQPDVAIPTGAQSKMAVDSSSQAEDLAQRFAEGLSSRFLANGSLGVLSQKLTSSQGGEGGFMALVSQIDVPRLANGLTQGVITGAGDGVQALGGINAIINGTSTPPNGSVPETKINFDDSVRGAAIGFGQGLGTSGVVTLQKLLARGIDLSPILGKRSEPARQDVVPYRRQVGELPMNSAPQFNLSRFIGGKAISVVAQKGVDVLTCDGVAGLLQVAIGLQTSGTLPSIGADGDGKGGLGKNAVNTIKTLIPTDAIEVVSKGTIFTIDGAKLADSLGGSMLEILSAVSINHFPALRYAAFLVTHISVAAFVLFFLVKHPELTPGDPLPGDLPHQLPPLTWASHGINQLLLALLLPTAVTGFGDLNSVTLCLPRVVLPFEFAVAAGMGIVFIFALGVYSFTARLASSAMAVACLYYNDSISQRGGLGNIPPRGNSARYVSSRDSSAGGPRRGSGSQRSQSWRGSWDSDATIGNTATEPYPPRK